MRRISFDALAAMRLPVTLALAGQLSFAPVAPALAQRSLTVVRDAEIEDYVADIARPVLGAAGLGQSDIQIVLVDKDDFNAFVGGRRIFMNTGTLMTAETPNEVIGVIAHEAGHIAGGHELRLRQQLARSQTMAIVAALAGIGAGLAGAAAGVKGAGLAMGGSGMVRRGFLNYRRTEEITADRAALEYLKKTGQSAKGMLATFERFESSLALAGVNVGPYELSHPMPRDRIANLEEQARQSPYYERADPPALQRRHDMARAKIAAYTQGPDAVARLFRDNRLGLPARYGDAISTYLHGSPREAIAKAERLIAEAPGNAFFHELRGDALLKANRATDSAAAYAKAIRLDSGNAGLLQVAYGRALLATGKPDQFAKAAAQIKTGLSRVSEYADGYAYLAQAYGRLGHIDKADLATAEGYFYAGNYHDSKVFALRARKGLKHGSPGRLRAEDIVNYQPVGKGG